MLMDISNIHNLFLGCSSVSIDTRKIEPLSMFFAIKGERYDANLFAAEALQKGAAFVIIDNASCYIDERTVLVADTLIALQELAAFHRRFLGIPIISLTGSNGKTTTKELINAVLSTKYSTGYTIGNLNNHIGVPLTLLSFTKDTQIGIVEMGANHQKEIEFLCAIANPDYGYITNFGKAHLEGFGGVQGVIKGKSEMYNYLRDNGKFAFVNADDPIQLDKTSGLRRFTFGVNTACDLTIEGISANPFVNINLGVENIHSKLIGLYNATNICAAIAIGKYFEVSMHDIRNALEAYVPDNNRSQLLNKGSNRIILDAYNANPSSMAVAIQNFVQLEDASKVLILGDMFELGDESLAEHKNIIGMLSPNSDVQGFFVGKDFFANRIDKPNLQFFENFESFLENARLSKIKNSVVLIKGSRGMALERTLEYLD